MQFVEGTEKEVSAAVVTSNMQVADARAVKRKEIGIHLNHAFHPLFVVGYVLKANRKNCLPLNHFIS